MSCDRILSGTPVPNFSAVIDPLQSLSSFSSSGVTGKLVVCRVSSIRPGAEIAKRNISVSYSTRPSSARVRQIRWQRLCAGESRFATGVLAVGLRWEISLLCPSQFHSFSKNFSSAAFNSTASRVTCSVICFTIAQRHIPLPKITIRIPLNRSILLHHLQAPLCQTAVQLLLLNPYIATA